ncbi:hypothetical protein PHJA_002445000 [Phtheirospermum japonicum]|uniref:Cardiolipin synthase N-terminal domain-containing protein n=1 Tax=Phtheirospermum japonicum TaxID=374723 RepID=A0A830D9K4_9LAMI|nr:hypothetical protein PHJA_002445000 [Phtheirospermum japonicum]
MIASSNILSSNFTHPPLKSISSPAKSSISPPKTLISLSVKSNCSSKLPKTSPFFLKQKKGQLQTCRSSPDTQTPQDPPIISSSDEENELLSGDGNGGGNGGDDRDWTTSFLLFAFWAGLMYYVLVLAPNQTPVTDLYFLKKLLNLKGDDGFEMNQVLVAEWYIMGLWPLVYSMLLLPTGRSSKSKIPVWPFTSLSVFGGAYALIPYFVLWRPPAPPVEASELRKWPLNFLESKLTAAIHIMSIDFGLFSTFAPFWVYNDMTARKWDDKGSWLLPLSLIPFLGPALYLLLRPSLPVAPMALAPESDET